MKKILFFLMLLSATSVFAQDVIVKKDGSTILSKVVEISSTEVKYKKFSNQNGPTYTITKAEIQAINYENGEKETFTDDAVALPQQSIVVNQYEDLLSSQKKQQKEKLLLSAKHWRNTGQSLGLIFMLAGAGIGAGIAAGDDWNMTPVYIAGGSGLGLGALTAMICGGIANNKEEEARTIALLPLIKQDFEIGSGHLSAGLNILNDRNSNSRTLGVGICWNF